MMCRILTLLSLARQNVQSPISPRRRHRLLADQSEPHLLVDLGLRNEHELRHVSTASIYQLTLRAVVVESDRMSPAAAACTELYNQQGEDGEHEDLRHETDLLLDDIGQALSDPLPLVLAPYHQHVDVPCVSNALERRYQNTFLDRSIPPTLGPRHSFTNVGNSTIYCEIIGQLMPVARRASGTHRILVVFLGFGRQLTHKVSETKSALLVPRESRHRVSSCEGARLNSHTC